MQPAGPNSIKTETHTSPKDATECGPTEEALRQSEERWRSVFENSAIGVALTDLNGRFLATNPTFQKMLDYTESELQMLSFLEITHEEYREGNWALATELLDGKREQFQIEKQYRRKDGSLIWVSNNVSLVQGTESTPQLMLALSEDITERKQAKEALQKSEEALRKSEQRKHSLLEINNAIINKLTQEALFTSAYEAIRRVVSFDRAAFLLHQPETKTLKLVSMDSDAESEFFCLGKDYDLEETRISAWVLDRQQAVVRGDLEKEQQSAGRPRGGARGG